MHFIIETFPIPTFGVTLAGPAEGDNPEFDVTFPTATVTSVDNRSTTGTRLATASCTAIVTLRAAKVDQTLDALPVAAFVVDYINASTFSTDIQKALKEALSPNRCSFKLPVKVVTEYSVKGVRTPEAMAQRAEDAVAIASHTLQQQRSMLVTVSLLEMRALFSQALAKYNSTQLRPLQTCIDLGLRPVAHACDRVDRAKEAHAGAATALEAARHAESEAWASYSRAYKLWQLEDLHDTPGIEGQARELLKAALLNNIDPATPIRFL